MCTSLQRRGRNEFEQAGVGGVVLALQSAALSEDACYCAITR
jgi:hypothetical protein